MVIDVPEGKDGKVRLHIFTPENPRAVMFRIHGGGWAAGTPEVDDVLNDRVARAAGVVIVSPEYQLTPDVTVAQQIAEVTAVASWLGSNAKDLFGTDKLLIGGISAGGHLAAATLITLRENNDPAFAKFVGAHLDCGAYDLAGSPSNVLADDNTLILNRGWIDGLADLGLPGLSHEEKRHPSLSPAFANLDGFPPTLFTVGALDPLRDDSIILAARLQLAGRDAQVDVWPEGAHAFTNMATPLGEVAFERNVGWMNDLLDEN
jgi:acetyl esterase/lipase